MTDTTADSGQAQVFGHPRGLMTLFFTEQPVTTFAHANACDQDLFARYFLEMLSRGIYLAPSQFEAAFVSLAHSDVDIEATIKANYEALKVACA